MFTPSEWFELSLAALLLLGFLGIIIGIIQWEFRDFQKRRATRRLAELTSIQKRIKEVESDLPQLTANARSTASAEDYGSGPWQKRTENRVAEVQSDQALLRDLKAREKELIKLLNKDG